MGYTIVQGPEHSRAPEGSPLASYHHAVFETEDGERITRYLSDKGFAEIVRRQGENRAGFTAEELERWTVPPDMEALEARYEAEAGEGA
jgi:hypothetical protein